MFEEIQRLRKIKSLKIRQKGYNKLVAEMELWTQVYYVHDGMKELVNKVKNGNEFWFTCVLYPEVEPTNNLAERGLRKFARIKKTCMTHIFGYAICLKRYKGLEK